MTDRAQAVGGFATLVAVVGVVLVVVALVGFAVADAVTSGEVRAYHDKAASWCDEHDGTLYNSQVTGHHGGLHCDLGDRTVHLRDVATAGWPSNASAIPTH